MATTSQPQTGVSCDEALRVARIDAESAYRDLRPFKILVCCEADGWHVDYELKNPNWNGGGPHYVIDPVTGQIVSKVYEQ